MNSKSQKRKDIILNIGVCFSMIVLTLIILAAFTQSAVASGPDSSPVPRCGAQAVVFPRWNLTSVNNLVSAVNETLPPEFELSQCPFFGDVGKRWTNTLQFLTGVNSNVGVVGTFFLSFHNDNPSVLLNTDYQWRASNLSSFLTTTFVSLNNKSPIEKLGQLVISPQLEDYWDDTLWQAKMKLVLDQLHPSILASGKLTLRRSVVSQTTQLNNTNYFYAREGKNYLFPINVEKHGFRSSPSWPNDGTMATWSNDGHFVYYPQVINGITEAYDSVYPQVPSYSFNQFIGVAKIFVGNTTLWRPSMNLWRREVSGSSAGSSGGKVTWFMEGNAWERSDASPGDSSATSFDAREKQVMKDYINSISK